MGKIVESHSILKWMDTEDGTRCDLFLQDWGETAESSGRAWKKLVAEFGESVYFSPAVARAVANEMRPRHHARTGSILTTTTDGVVKAAVFRRTHEKSRWNVDCWNALLVCHRKRSKFTEAIPAPRPHIIHPPLTPRRRCVTRADLRKFGVAIGCSACSVIAVHGKTSKPHTEVHKRRPRCRKRN